MKKETMTSRINTYFNGKKESEITLIYLVIFLAIFGIAYLYLFEPSEDYARNYENKLRDISTKLASEQNYMTSVSHGAAVTQHQNQLKQIKNVLTKANNTNMHIDKRLKELSYLLFNEKNWANFIDELAFLGDKYRVEVKKISNDFYEPTLNKIEQVLNVTLKVDGNFNNIVKLINAIEENELVIDVKELNISQEEKTNNLEGTMKIAVWGMKY